MKPAVEKTFKILSAVLLIGAAVYLNRSGLFQKTLDWIEGLGAGAPWVFLLVYVLTCIFFVPSFIFTFASGILFGLGRGIFLSVLGAGLGSTAAFLIGRFFAREWVSRAFANNREFLALSEASRLRGWRIVLLARLSPIFPFLVGNYAFGLTSIRARDYFFASVLGTLPSSAVYVYAGTVTGSLASLGGERSRTPAEWALLAAGLAATVVLSLYLRKVARQALAGQLPPSRQEP